MSPVSSVTSCAKACTTLRKAEPASVMVTGLEDVDDTLLDPIDQAMLERDPPRPPARQVTLQWLGLTYAFRGCLGDVRHESLDSFKGTRFLPLPISPIFQGARGPADLSHGEPS
jgi:hypothetical protein